MLKVQFNSAHMVILCSTCNKVVKVGYKFNRKERDFVRGEIKQLPAQYCKKCKRDSK